MQLPVAPAPVAPKQRPFHAPSLGGSFRITYGYHWGSFLANKTQSGTQPRISKMNV